MHKYCSLDELQLYILLPDEPRSTAILLGEQRLSGGPPKALQLATVLPGKVPDNVRVRQDDFGLGHRTKHSRVQSDRLEGSALDHPKHGRPFLISLYHIKQLSSCRTFALFSNGLAQLKLLDLSRLDSQIQEYELWLSSNRHSNASGWKRKQLDFVDESYTIQLNNIIAQIQITPGKCQILLQKLSQDDPIIATKVK